VALTEVERQLRREWGGRWVYLSSHGERAGRDAAIVQALEHGVAVKALAQSLRLSERWVRKIGRRGGVL
jgi:Mor family transcriptional regulator